MQPLESSCPAISFSTSSSVSLSPGQGRRLSQHRGMGAKGGGLGTEPLWLVVCLPSTPTPHSGTAMPAHVTLAITPIFETRRISDKSKGGRLGCRPGAPSEPGLCPRQCQLGVQVPSTHCPFLDRGALGGPSHQGETRPPATLEAVSWGRLLRLEEGLMGQSCGPWGMMVEETRRQHLCSPDRSATVLPLGTVYFAGPPPLEWGVTS